MGPNALWDKLHLLADLPYSQQVHKGFMHWSPKQPSCSAVRRTHGWTHRQTGSLPTSPAPTGSSASSHTSAPAPCPRDGNHNPQSKAWIKADTVPGRGGTELLTTGTKAPLGGPRTTHGTSDSLGGQEAPEKTVNFLFLFNHSSCFSSQCLLSVAT